MSKEFFPLKNWDAVDELLQDDAGLKLMIKDMEVNGIDLKSIRSQLNMLLQKAASSLQQNAEWVSVRETVTYQHKVKLNLTPAGRNRAIEVDVLMGLDEIGIESKLIGKSVQSQPSKVSFNLKKISPNHPLASFSNKNFNGVLAIQNVFRPPIKLPLLKEGDSDKSFGNELLELLRSLSFSLAKDICEELRPIAPEDKALKFILRSIGDYLDYFSSLPDKFQSKEIEQIKAIGIKFDPEMELAYMQSMHQVYLDKKQFYMPEAFQNHIETLFKERYKIILKEIVEQIHEQQNKIQQRFKNYANLEVNKKRMVQLKTEVDQQKKKGASEESLRSKKQELKKLFKGIQTVMNQYESSKGIILMHELLLSNLNNDEELTNLLPAKKLDEVKTKLQANHISAARDIETLTRNLGMHADHLLVQHAIYSETEPDISQVVVLESIGNYDTKQLDSILSFMPSLKNKFKDGDINATALLQTVWNGEIPDREKEHFIQFQQSNTDPKNNIAHRFSEQLEQFIQVSDVHKGDLDSMVSHLEQELANLKAVIQFAMEKNKLNTDFKNHLRYFEQLFIDPYTSFLEQCQHESAEDIERHHSKLRNMLKVSLDIKYTAPEEKALLSMFKQVHQSLQNKNLFLAGVFTQQIKKFMHHLTSFKTKISGDLLKKILSTYTVFMMGSSRTKNLSKQASSGISNDDVAKIKANRDSLTQVAN